MCKGFLNMKDDISKVVDAYWNSEIPRHVVVGKRKHTVEMRAEDRATVACVVRDKLIDFHKDFLGKSPIIFDRDVDLEQVSNSIKKGLTAVYLVDYLNYPRNSFDIISLKGRSLLTLVSYEFNIETNGEYLYMVTPGIEYDMQRSFIRSWKNSKTQKASLDGYDVQSVIDNLLVERLNKFNGFILNGRTLRAFENEDEMKKEVKEIERFQMKLTNGINGVINSYDPKFKGTLSTKEGITDYKYGCMSKTKYGELLKGMMPLKDRILEGITDDELDIYLKLHVISRLFKKMFDGLGADHPSTNEYRDYIINWSKGNLDMQKKLNFNITDRIKEIYLTS